MPTSSAAWKIVTLKPGAILLDAQNPRIEVPKGVDQLTIRTKLLDLEDVLDLARRIERNNGIFHGERIITTVEDGKTIVLEGNRRVAACQMLITPSLVPTKYKSRFPTATEPTLANIRNLQADQAPNRQTAEPILTARHTERGAKPWSPVAKMRRAVRLLEHLSIDEASGILGTTPSAMKRLVRPYKLLQYALNLKGWSEPERVRLEDEKLKTTAYTRLFTLAPTQAALQITFDDSENIISALKAPAFKKEMARIARDFLLPDPSSGKPLKDTRTSASEYFAHLLPPTGKKEQSEPGDQQKKPQGKTEGATNSDRTSKPARPATPKGSIFFENLMCHVVDDRLIRMTTEIKSINHKNNTISASLLLRALFECALVWKMQQTKTWSTLMQQLKAANPNQPAGRDPGLEAIIKFAGNHTNGVFAEQNICKQLRAHTTTQAKSYLDSMTHYKYVEADAPTLESVANNLRQIIVFILAGHP